VTRRWLVVLGVATAACLACVSAASSGNAGATRARPRIDRQIHKIRHVVVIMQENRSFDSYFGTYPGADGIPMRNGVPTVCVPDPAHGGCRRPYHDPSDVNGGGPHTKGRPKHDFYAESIIGKVAAGYQAQTT
jgi:phospholipase C